MILPAILIRSDFLYIPFLDQTIDLVRRIGEEMLTKEANSLMVGSSSAIMISMQKVSTAVRLASRF